MATNNLHPSMAGLSDAEQADMVAQASYRVAHVARGDGSIVRHASGASLLNDHHRQLLAAARPTDPRLAAAAQGGGGADGAGGDPASAPHFMLAVVREGGA